MAQAHLDQVWERFILGGSLVDFLKFYEGTKFLVYFKAYYILGDKRKATKACAQVYLRLRSRNFNAPVFMPWERTMHNLIDQECRKLS